MTITIHCSGCQAALRVREEYAGQAMRCPRCSAALTVPAAADEPVVATVVEETPRAAHTAVKEGEPRPRSPGPVMACPKCGKTIPATARRCRHCQVRLEEEEEDPADRYLPCPRCGERHPVKVEWTWWGSYLGPKLCNQVRCPECAHSYNGATGSSNLVAKMIFVTVPLLLIAGILLALYFVLKAKNAI